MKISLAIALMLTAMELIGCASIASGTKQSITVTSNVPGAQITHGGVVIGVTPFTGQVPRGEGKSLVITMVGYAEQTIPMSTQITGAFWGNILIGGTTGSTTDMGTGAAYEYAPSNFYVDLVSASRMPLSQRKSTEIKQFAMIHFDAISRDVANGQGEYLKSICLLVSGKVDDASLALVKSALMSANGDVVRFGESLAAEAS